MRAEITARLKKRAKAALLALPMGKELLFPAAVQAIIARQRLAEVAFREAKHAREWLEAQRILASLRGGRTRRVTVVYDRAASPPTYGDYFYVVMLARWFATRSVPTELAIVDGEFDCAWSAIRGDAVQSLKEGQLDVARVLLDVPGASMNTWSWSQFRTRLEASDVGRVPFLKRVRARQDVYSSGFNLINHLAASSTSDHIARFLLDFREIAPNVRIERPAQPYVTVHCRRSFLQGQDRNMPDEAFPQIHRRLRELYPGLGVMVVSDGSGCAHFKELARRHQLDCLFSKDISSTFMGDAALILGGRFHFSLRGGGIDCIPFFSTLAYECHLNWGYETPWAGIKATPWSGDHQLAIEMHFSPKTFLPSGRVRA